MLLNPKFWEIVYCDYKGVFDIRLWMEHGCDMFDLRQVDRDEFESAESNLIPVWRFYDESLSKAGVDHVFYPKQEHIEYARKRGIIE